MISEQNEMILVSELRRDEDVEHVEYLDSEGVPTTGVGHNLRASPLPSGWTFPLTDVQVDQLLETDLENTYRDLSRAVPWWSGLDDVRQRVLCNMCFNMGITRLLGFKNMLAAMQRGQYTDAAFEMLHSKWAAQVKQRAVRLAFQMRNGT